MSDKKRLMLPNDARWEIVESTVFFKTVDGNMSGFTPFTLSFPESMQRIQNAAAVAACWFKREHDKTYRVPFSDPKWVKNVEWLEFLHSQFVAWLSLTTATSLDGYEFVSWKEME